jgi:hypothetical protein
MTLRFRRLRILGFLGAAACCGAVGSFGSRDALGITATAFIGSMCLLGAWRTWRTS